MGGPKWQSELSVQWNHYYIPGGSISSSEAKTSRPTQHKVTGTGSNIFASGSLGLYSSPHSYPTSSSSSFHMQPCFLSLKPLPNSPAGRSHPLKPPLLSIALKFFILFLGDYCVPSTLPLPLWSPESSEEKGPWRQSTAHILGAAMEICKG